MYLRKRGVGKKLCAMPYLSDGFLTPENGLRETIVKVEGRSAGVAGPEPNAQRLVLEVAFGNWTVWYSAGRN
jgi:hypothetical protein